MLQRQWEPIFRKPHHGIKGSEGERLPAYKISPWLCFPPPSPQICKGRTEGWGRLEGDYPSPHPQLASTHHPQKGSFPNSSKSTFWLVPLSLSLCVLQRSLVRGDSVLGERQRPSEGILYRRHFVKCLLLLFLKKQFLKNFKKPPGSLRCFLGGSQRAEGNGALERGEGAASEKRGRVFAKDPPLFPPPRKVSKI